MPRKKKKYTGQVGDIVDLDLYLVGRQNQRWLKKRYNKLEKQRITHTELQILHDVFVALDEDKSGSIGTDEIWMGFKSLGLDVAKNYVQLLVDQVDQDGSGMVEFGEFVEVMMMSEKQGGEILLKETWAEELAKLREDKKRKKQPYISFSLIACGLRRKRILEAIYGGRRDHPLLAGDNVPDHQRFRKSVLEGVELESELGTNQTEPRMRRRRRRPHELIERNGGGFPVLFKKKAEWKPTYVNTDQNRRPRNNVPLEDLRRAKSCPPEKLPPIKPRTELEYHMAEVRVFDHSYTPDYAQQRKEDYWKRCVPNLIDKLEKV